MKQIGSQMRETLKEANYSIYDKDFPDEIILQDNNTGIYELWAPNDDYAGYVIEINGIGHEYIHDIDDINLI